MSMRRYWEGVLHRLCDDAVAFAVAVLLVAAMLTAAWQALAWLAA